MTAASDRHKTAAHEVGHGLAARLTLQRPPELLSMRAGKSYHAITFFQQPTTTDTLLFGTPSILQPEGLRRAVETQIVISLAGDLAETWASGRDDAPGYPEPSADTTAAETAATSLARLSPRHRELLATTETELAVESDDETTERFSFAFTGNRPESELHLMWMRAVARKLLIRHIDVLRRLTDELARLDVMNSDAFEAIFSESRCACHYRSRGTQRAGNQVEQSTAAQVVGKKKGDAS